MSASKAPSAESTEPAQFHADDRVQEEAALWFARMRGEAVSTRRRARFDAWLAADAAHRREYEILQQIWDQSARLVPPQAGRRRLLKGATALASLAALAFWLNLAWFDGRISTEGGERRHMQLADGSELDIAPNTRLRVKLGDTLRSVELSEGQIAITVAADPNRPLEVRAAGGVIRDIGTRFEVQASQRQGHVAVAEGIVDISVSAQGENITRRLRAGEATDFNEQGIAAPQAVEAATALAWTKGQLAFDAVPLAQVILVLNRYRKTPIDLADPALASLRVSGVFLIDDENAALRALETVAPIRFVPEADRIIARPAGRGDS
jgi:transmembrane sensor